MPMHVVEPSVSRAAAEHGTALTRLAGGVTSAAFTFFSDSGGGDRSLCEVVSDGGGSGAGGGPDIGGGDPIVSPRLGGCCASADVDKSATIVQGMRIIRIAASGNKMIANLHNDRNFLRVPSIEETLDEKHRRSRVSIMVFN
jgi:hypothetical protein